MEIHILTEKDLSGPFDVEHPSIETQQNVDTGEYVVTLIGDDKPLPPHMRDRNPRDGEDRLQGDVGRLGPRPLGMGVRRGEFCHSRPVSRDVLSLFWVFILVLSLLLTGWPDAVG